MSGPLDSLRQFYHQTVAPLQERVVDVAEGAKDFVGDLADAAGDVGRAVVDGAGDVADAVTQKGVLDVAAGVVKHDVQTGAQVLTELGRRSPQDFVDWLAGPEGPSVSEATALVPGLQNAIGGIIDKSMQNPMIAGAIGQVFGFKYIPGQDFYTTGEHSVQSYLGFHEAYDKVGKLLGMDLDSKAMEFSVGDADYKLELWKGSYGSGGAYGGEIGLYTRNNDDHGAWGRLLEHVPGYYSAVDGKDQIRMTQTIYNTEDGKPYFTNAAAGAEGTDGEHFWNLAIRTDPSAEHANLGQKGTLELGDAEVAAAMCAEMNRQGVPAELGADGKTIHYVWE